jgi:hypothetical protein
MPVVNTSQTFATGDTVTSTTLNNIMDQSIFEAGAVVSSSGLDITAGGQMTIADNGVPGGKITNGTITGGVGGKIANNTITVGNLASPSFNWSSASNIGAIELGTNITTNGPSYVDFHSVFPLTDYEARVIRNSGTDGTLDLVNNGTGAITLSASGGVTFGTANMPTPSGTAPIYGTRAWVNFNATSNADLGGTYVRDSSTTVNITATAHGLIAGNKVFLDFTVGTGTSPFDGVYVVAATPAPTVDTFSVVSNVSTSSTGTVLLKRKSIRASGNVSCVSPSQLNPPTPPTSNQTIDTGYHIVNFSTALPDANYAISGFSNYTSSAIAGFVGGNSTTAFTPESCEITIGITTTGGAVNPSIVTAMFIR